MVCMQVALMELSGVGAWGRLLSRVTVVLSKWRIDVPAKFSPISIFSLSVEPSFPLLIS